MNKFLQTENIQPTKLVIQTGCVMKPTLLLISLALAFFSVSAQSADTRAAEVAVIKALTCEIRDGKTASVIKAIKTLGAKSSKDDGDYRLASPIKVFGLEVDHMFITPSNGEGPDSYGAIFANANPSDIAAAAQLKPLAGTFSVRDTKSGRLEADVRNRTDVWLVCTPLRSAEVKL